MMNALQFVIFIFLSVIIEIECNEKESCVNEKLRQCSDRYKTNHQIYPTSIDDLKQYCRIIEQKDECFRNSWMECISGAQERQVITSRLNESSSDHYRHICNLSSTYSKMFVKYGKCLNLTVSEQNKCQNKYKLMNMPKSELLSAVGISKNNSLAENALKFRQICCWWVEYQTCSIKAVVDRCGEHAALLVNEEFFKVHTSKATSKLLTYKSCVPRDNSFRYPVCFVDKPITPESIGLTFSENEMSIEDNSRFRDIEETIGLASNLTDSIQMEASIDSHDISFSSNLKISQLLSFILILFIFIRTLNVR